MSTLIYLLDDDREFSEEIVSLLSDFAQVTCFHEPAELIQAWQSCPPELLLVDVNLHSALDGIALARLWQTVKGSHLVPFVLLSGESDPEMVSRAFASGASDFLTKPVMAGFFREKIRHVIRQNRKQVHANPLTGLPGISLIEEAYRSHGSSARSVAYIDLDHFKPFNDAKGVKAGDRAIVLFADLLRNAAGNRIFLGHLGGDDFFMIDSDAGRLRSVLQALFRTTSQLDREFFTPAEIRQKFYVAADRDGKVRKFPLLSVSVALVHVEGELSFDQLSLVAAETKKGAKASPGNSLAEITIGEPVTDRSRRAH